MQRSLGILLLLSLFLGPVFATDHALLGERNTVVLSSSEPISAVLLPTLQEQLAGDLPTGLTVVYPLEGAAFPADIAAPTFRWSDTVTTADTWLVEIVSVDNGERVTLVTQGATAAPGGDTDPASLSEATLAYKPPTPVVPVRRWCPESETWERIKELGRGSGVTVTIVGLDSADPGTLLSRGKVSFYVSDFAVEAPIFYRDVPLPFAHVLKNLKSIRWRLGDVSQSAPPPTLLTNMKLCGNCHSFSADGKTLAMDVDYGSDKGSYVIADIESETVLTKENVISWSDYQRNEKDPTFGLLSQISPDGRYVISTVKDRSVFSPTDDLFYSQRFFPITGILVVYDRQTQSFFSLPGADDRQYVQSNPVWSPDGKTILFARAKAYKLPNLKDPSSALLTREEVNEFFEGGRLFRFDIYSIPFNDGKGGDATPLAGASFNGKSNFFPRYSPDGKWIVFCQSDSFMLLRPDSMLHILPAAGGTPRPMRCNFPGHMNSWHSFSPNGHWLVFSTKVGGPFTQLWLTHIDEKGNDSPAVWLETFTATNRAANIPEFVKIDPQRFAAIRQEFADYYSHYRAATLHETRHNYVEAIAEYKLALQEKPDHVESLYLLASCLARVDQEPEAIQYARQAIALAPNSVKIHGLLGALLVSAGQHGKALMHLQAAYKATPKDISIASNLAWVLATAPQSYHRNGPRAVELAQWVNKVTGYKSPPLLDTLAAAYAEAGLFDKAVRTTQKAIELVRRNPQASTVELEERLRLYQSGLPFHE